MKKILKLIGICIGLPLIVIAIITVIQLIFMITFDDLEKLKQFIFLPTFFAYVIFLPLYYSLSYVKGKKLLEQLDIKKIDKREIVYIVLFGIGISFILSILAGMLTLVFQGYSDISNMIEESNNSLIQMLLMVILIPICEELLFRGIIFRYLKNNYNIVLAVVLQALAFGVYHMNIVQGIYTFVLGIALGLIYMYSESMLGCIILHMVYNLFGGLVIPTVMSGNIVISIGTIIIAIVLFIFSIIKMSEKYKEQLNKILYEE